MVSTEVDWDHLPAPEKRRVLTERHRTRQAQLAKIEKRGKTVETFLARLQNEAQYQRLIAVYGNHQCNLEPILKLCREAKVLWPTESLVVIEQARFFRYVWEHAKAIELFREVILTTTQESLRQEAIADLVETLLTAAQHAAQLVFSDGVVTDAPALLTEAEAQLKVISGKRRTASEIALLRERVALELGRPLDWQSIDDAFNYVIGDVDKYLKTVLHNLDSLTQTADTASENIAGLVHDHWTDSEVLRCIGTLYLRRAELNSADQFADWRKAYAAFQACRIQEVSWLARHRETTTTKWQRAQAILRAASVAGTVNPFQADPEGKRDLLHLAEALFQGCATEGVGVFCMQARQKTSEVSKLRRALLKGRN